MSDQASSAAADVMATEARWVEAHRGPDPAAIAAILDDDYKRILPDNSVIGKREVIDSYASGQRHWEVAEGSDYTVQMLDNVAIVTGVWRGVGVNHGQRFDYHARFLAVYVRRDMGWKLYRDETFDF